MKRILCLLTALLLCLVLTTTAFAAPPCLVDEAGLLTAEEAVSLQAKLDEISTRQQFDVVVVTVEELDGRSVEAYADDYYDYNGYGYGEDRDGILLLVAMEERVNHITTTGYGITAFTDAGLDYIAGEFEPLLSDGAYAAAFEAFATRCDEFVTQARTGDPYDGDNLPKGPFGWFTSLLIALAVGGVLAFIQVGSMKSKLKSVRPKPSATDYVCPGSLQLQQQQDLFLYHTVTRVERPKDSGGGSSTHTGSSGTSHGGRSGSF